MARLDGAAAELRKAARRGGRLSRWIRTLLALGCGILVGTFLFDRVVMPLVVRHGDEVSVPAVGGRELAQAESDLRAAGLRPLVLPGRHHAVVAPGRVLDVAPQAGLMVKRGRQVVLTPSLGSFRRAVPNLVGESIRLARMRLSDAGLSVGQLMYAANDLVGDDLVMAMEPEGGKPAPDGGTVSLLVSRARSSVPYWLPDLRGFPGGASETLLQQGGFRVTVESGEGGDPGTVVRQDPPAGSPLWPGARVVLTVVPGWRGSWDRG